MQPLSPAASAAAARCPVCGFPGLEVDQVAFTRSLLVLYECPRCEHRSTARAEVAPPPSVPAAARRPRLARPLPDAA
jgi:predicted RNA-binding Zn-ribbon protein involved in translation (DUF1610 family)